MLTSCQVNGKIVSYYKVGNGKKNLLLLHGWPVTKEIFEKVLPLLANEGYCVIAPDLPGFGMSQPLDGVSSYESISQAMINFVNELAIEKFSIGGTSMGAITAIWMSNKELKKINYLILNSPSFRAWEIMSPMQKVLLKTTQKIKFLRELLFWGMNKNPQLFCQLVWGLNISQKNLAFNKILDSAKRSNLKTLWEMLLDDAYNSNSLNLLKKLTVPIKFFGGDNDSVYLQSSVKIAQMFPKIQLITLPGASHFLPFENPELFAKQFIPKPPLL